MTTDLDRPDHPDHVEPLPLPHFVAGLWDELAQLHEHRRTDDRTAAAAPTPIEQHHERHRQRGRRSIYVGAGAVAAAVAAVVAVSVAQPNGPSDEVMEPPSGDAVRLGTTVVAAIEQAETTTIVHEVLDMVDPGPEDGMFNQTDVESWVDWASPDVDVRQQIRDQDGTLVEELGWQEAPALEGEPSLHRRLDHVDHTVTDECTTTPGGVITASGEEFAAVIHEQLAKGDYFEDGTETIDGQELIVIRFGPDALGDTGRSGSDESAIYVDPETYLPVRFRIYEDGRLDVDRTTEYLPRTPENVALAGLPPVPAGYSRIGPPVDGC